MLEQGNALRQELHNQAFAHYVEESQVSTLKNNLEHQQKRSHNEEQQFHDSFTNRRLPCRTCKEKYRGLPTLRLRCSSSLPCRCALLPKSETRNVSRWSLSFLQETNNTSNCTIPWQNTCSTTKKKSRSTRRIGKSFAQSGILGRKTRPLSQQQLPSSLPHFQLPLQQQSSSLPSSNLGLHLLCPCPCSGTNRERLEEGAISIPYWTNSFESYSSTTLFTNSAKGWHSPLLPS